MDDLETKESGMIMRMEKIKMMHIYMHIYIYIYAYVCISHSKALFEIFYNLLTAP